MKMWKKIHLIIIIVLYLSACSNELPPEKYIDWVKDYGNGLHQRNTLGEYILDVQLEPIEYMALKQLRGEVDEAAMQEFKGTEQDMQYFLMKLAVANGEDLITYRATSQEEVQNKIYYLSYHLQNDIFLEVGGKKLPCKIFHFERSFDLAPGRTFVLGFELSENSAQVSTLVINSALLGQGPVKMKFKTDKLPKLAL